MALFEDRWDAGRQLAEQLSRYVGRNDVVVLGLPRGGVVVAYEVAKELHVPLDVFLVRKLGVPGHEELAMGAIASGGVRVLNDHVVHMLNISSQEIDHIATHEQQELERRERDYRGGRHGIDVQGRTVILIDDGLATGATMRAAVAALRKLSPARIIVAVPVAPLDTCAELQSEVDDIICVATPEPFFGVGMWYADFAQTTDEEVKELLKQGEGLLSG